MNLPDLDPKKIKSFIVRSTKSWFSVFAIFFLIFFVIPDIKINNYFVYGYDINLWIRILFFLLYFFYFFIRKYTLLLLRRKHKNRLGIAFRITSSTLNDYSFNQDRFFTKLYNDLNNNDIDVYFINFDDYKKIHRQYQNEHNFFNKLGLCLVLDIDEREGKKDSITKYGFNIDYFHYSFPSGRQDIDNLLKKDLINSINNVVEIQDNNDYDDFYNNSINLEAGIEYMMSIFFIIFNKKDCAGRAIEKTKSLLTCSSVHKDDKIQYIFNKISLREMEISHFDIRDIDFDKNNYDINYAIKMESKLVKFKKQIDYNKNKLNKNEYNVFYYDYVIKMIVCYYIQNKREEIDILLKNNKYNDLTLRFDKAFILATKGDFSASYNLYNRLLKDYNRKNNKDDTLDKLLYEIYAFFDHFVKHNIDVEANLFCKCTCSYLTGKTMHLEKNMEKLRNLNEYAYNIIVSRTNNK